MKKPFILLMFGLLAISSNAYVNASPVPDTVTGETEYSPNDKAVRERATYFAAKIFDAIETDSMELLEDIGTEIREYIATLDERQAEIFGEAFAEAVYDCSESYGYGREFADDFLSALVSAVNGTSA